MTLFFYLSLSEQIAANGSMLFNLHQLMVSMHLNSFSIPVVAQLKVTLARHKASVARLLLQGYKVNRLSNTFRKFYGRTLI